MRRLVALDALRGVAALIVALHHFLMLSIGHGIPVVPFLAVDLFFAISGFVMARTYEERLRSGSLAAVAFVGLRYRRLFLPLAVGTSFGLIWRLSFMPPSLDLAAAYALALAFLPAFWLGNAFLFNVPAWSLYLEIVSNALHGSVLARMSRRALLGLMVGSAVVTIILLAFGFAHWGYGIVPIVSCLPRELSFYLAGILIFRTWGDAPFTGLNGRWAFWLGALSYPLYATHVPVMHLARTLGLGPISGVAAALAVAWLIAVAFKRPRWHFPGFARVRSLSRPTWMESTTRF